MVKYKRITDHWEDPDPPEFSEEELRQKCCNKFRTPIPKCKVKTRKWEGFDVEEIRRMYNIDPDGPIRIKMLGPEGGICGKKTEHWELPSKDCCKDVADLEYDETNSVEVLAPNSFGRVYVNGGRTPIIWTVYGTGIHFSNGKNQIVGDQGVRVFTDENFCGTARIKAYDECSTAWGYIRATVGQWNLIGSFEPTEEYDPASHGYFQYPWSGYGCGTCTTWYQQACELYKGPYKAVHTACQCGWTLWAKCGVGHSMPGLYDTVAKQFYIYVLQGWALHNDGVNCGGGDFEVNCFSIRWKIYKWTC